MYVCISLAGRGCISLTSCTDDAMNPNNIKYKANSSSTVSPRTHNHLPANNSLLYTLHLLKMAGRANETVDATNQQFFHPDPPRYPPQAAKWVRKSLRNQSYERDYC